MLTDPTESTPTPLPNEGTLSMSQIREKLAGRPIRRLAQSDELAHAAVAMILREDSARNEQDILIIQRAEHPHDPWSGHLGFPGGRLEEGDATPERAAVRETEEELGFSLDNYAKLLGPLSEIRARSLMQLMPLTIFPFVYELVEPAPLQWNVEEVVEARWIPLRYFLDASNRSTMPHPRKPEHILPCYPLGNRAIWGLSLSMLDELLFKD